MASGGSFDGKEEPAGYFEPPSVQLLKGGGTIHGMGEKFSASLVTGTASITVPIFTRPVRPGFGSQLSLSSDFRDGNGPFGWSLSSPSITRKSDKDLSRHQEAEESESDIFLLSGSEDLFPLLNPDKIRFNDCITVPGLKTKFGFDVKTTRSRAYTP